MFKPETRLDRVFEVAIVLKGLNGLAESVGGVLLLLVSPNKLQSLVVLFTQTELSEDPGDLVAKYLLKTADGITGAGLVFGAAYLLSHGVVKIVLVVALLLDRLWAYPWMIGVLIAFIGYQLYRIALSPTLALVALTLFDLVIVFLTWREYGHKRERLSSRPPDAIDG